MDDQLLEKRLESLKSAYDDMPEDENRSAILAAIKKDQKKQKQNKWFHLRYAASFIGVGMIAGVLMMQYIGDHAPSEEETEQHQAASSENSSGELEKSDVKEVFDDLEEYYQERELQTKEKLGFLSGFENYLYRNIPMELNDSESAFLSDLEAYKQTDLEDTRKRLTSEIDQAFTMPSEMIDKLLQEKSDDVYISGPEFILLNQLESFLGAYYLSMTYYEDDINKAIEKENADEVVKKMNAGGEGLSSPGLKEMSSKAVDNGYAFREEEGRIVPYVNFSGLADRLRGAVNEDFIKYLELRTNRVQDRNGEIISFEGLADLLVKLEKTISAVKNPIIEERMRNDAKSLYALFVVSPYIYDKNEELKSEAKQSYLYMLETYPETDTAAAVNSMFKKMQSNQFQKPADGEKLDYPRYLEIPAHLKREDVIDKKVLPLPDPLLSSYKEFAAKKDFNILKNYGPFEIMQLYFHADETGDYETKYALYSKNGGQPPKDQYIEEMKAAEVDISVILKGYEYATLYYSNDDPEKIIGIQLLYNDRTDAPVFQMVQEDGFWKVQFLPLQ
ncbi:hypothetical protein [Mesobacillus jeotgali]|uniref:Uncharacterized protein n=1 Tax=Mesobacillus jeotgali TaxID=129985 RepID=A0ABY9VIB7_9BACI|nr:hypothetical protein [Mesobacillus jeotgali]WNF22345.1 hypothetical protein RH061_19635 [Mesobacillus jeotgali]